MLMLRRAIASARRNSRAEQRSAAQRTHACVRIARLGSLAKSSAQVDLALTYDTDGWDDQFPRVLAETGWR